MLRFIIPFFALHMFPIPTALAQPKPVSLLDSALSAGNIYSSSGITFADCETTYTPESSELVDSIYLFLDKNPRANCEIRFHVNYQDCKPSCTLITQGRAKNLRDTLVKKGIAPGRLTAKGYGATMELIPEIEINKFKIEMVRESLRAKNRRVELKITSISPLPGADSIVTFKVKKPTWGEFRIVIQDHADHEPIRFAKTIIRIDEKDELELLTDSLGALQPIQIQAGLHSVGIWISGYFGCTMSGIEVRDGKSAWLNYMLTGIEATKSANQNRKIKK